MAVKQPTQIEVRGGNVNNLKNINVDIPLNQFVAISGPSGSGKSSLAMGILYAEGSRRYLEALSTYTRRRITQNKRSQVQEVRHIPSAIALRQRPSVPSERSTVGSMSEIFNVVRLIFSRLGTTRCPNGHEIQPSLQIAQAMDLAGDKMGVITCPTCQVEFMAKSAEDFAFNSAGACPECHGTGQIQTLDDRKIIADENLSIEDGAIASWRLPGRNFMPTVAAHIGVRIDVPYKDLTDEEKEIVLHGKRNKYAVDFHTSTGRVFSTENTLYENAYDAVYESLKSVKSDRAMAKVNSFFHFSTCPTCHGTRLNPELLTQTVGGQNIAAVSDMTLGALGTWVTATKADLPDEMQQMATILFKNLLETLQPLLSLGLDYLTLSRNGNTLSTGELQRIQLARTLRTATTGVLYVLDEPSIGLHPDNVEGLIHIFRQLVAQGNSLVVVDHEVNIISQADWVIEIGPAAGRKGGQVIAQGKPADLVQDPQSLIGPYIAGRANILYPQVATQAEGVRTTMAVGQYFNLRDVTIEIPDNQITAVSGFSGAGKTSLILDSLVPAIEAHHQHEQLPKQVTQLTTDLTSVVSIDAKPVGKNTRSTLATYTNIMTNLRKLFAGLPESQAHNYGIAHFSYNNKEGACPNCGGLGSIILDIQYLPDMEEVCPECQGKRYKPAIEAIKWHGYSIVDLLALSVEESIPVFADVPNILKELKILKEIGLGYLHLGESTPSLSGGEAQRLKLVTHLNKKRAGTLFVFDEPSVGLHPRDVETLMGVINQLKAKGATVIMITHDLDLMTNADYLIDLGPKGGSQGGQVMASGTPSELVASQIESLTLSYLRAHFKKFQLTTTEIG